MSNRAKVTSVEAIESFRNALIIYLSKARPTFEEITSDIARTRIWLESEQHVRWENELRRRRRKLEEAQNAFFSANMSNLREPTAAERMALTKTKAAVEEAEAKLKVIKRWNREFGTQVEPLGKQLERLHTMLANELPQAVSYLSQVVQKLHEYAAVATEPLKPAPESQTKKETS